MKKRAIIPLLIGGFLLFSAACVAGSPSARYQPFPAGYGYMQENDALIAAVKEADHAVVRQHGWKLWAGIIQPAKNLGWPIWYTWPNTKAAFAAGKTGLGQAQVQASRSMLAHNIDNLIPANAPDKPAYPIPEQVAEQYPQAICNQGTKTTICDGNHVVFNGDILIPTESLSMEAMDWIRNPTQPLYLQSTLNELHQKKVHVLTAPPRYIVTKHMYWPVKAAGLSAIPVWHNDYGPEYAGYAGYEKWADLIAVDPAGGQVGQTAQVTYLHGVFQPDGITPFQAVTKQAKVYSLDDFYHHQVTQADWDSFDEADKAIINASSYWAHNQPFAPGDYLVTIAMHVNTKEIPGWALQSVWWSDQPDQGPYAADRPALPQAQGPWRHYLLVDSYGIPETPGGNQPVATNPYIELAIHPVATNCNTCHMRAGWPRGPAAGQASSQNPDCPLLLATLNPDSACLESLTLTDFQWIIVDRAIK
jgi:hypothetical protein